MNDPLKQPTPASTRQSIRVYRPNHADTRDQDLIVEEPLSLRVQGRPYSVVMRTPGDETAHAAGFCLSEGLIDNLSDISAIGFCTEAGVNVATVTLTESRRLRAEALLARKSFISQTSCGICGKELIHDLQQLLRPLPLKLRLTPGQALGCANRLPDHQALHRQTRSAHGALIFDQKGHIIAAAEDVGRHNALDKAIGKLVMESRLDLAAFAVMSSRLSYELVQKGARAGLELMMGVSRPTSLAVALATSVNMTLTCARDDELMVFCGDERIGWEETD